MLEVRDIRKTYYQGKIPVHAVDGISFVLNTGELLAVTGPSGSGKSTLLNLIGGLDEPTDGELLISGQSMLSLNDADRTRMRRTKIGFIFQFFNLLPTMTAQENVALPLLLDGRARKTAYERAAQILERVGLGKRMVHRPDELSGGEQQRVAIARALAFDPVLILADEPTGNLDSKSGTAVMEMVRALATDFQKAVLLVTHDPRSWGYADRIMRIEDGRVQSLEANTPTPIGTDAPSTS
ncbi:MAG: ABC transporter ATP-binding protein [Deltaproteobacteria bacterium]|nr:ABC transporter ATP-binding protein [Deltaproteobacteria bacterium]